MASADDLKGKKLNAVRGRISTEQGLEDLLAGTGLDHRYIGNHAVALVRDAAATPITGSATTAAPPAAASGGASTPTGLNNSALQEIVVSAQRATDQLARRAEFQALNIVNMMTTDEIRRLPDVNTGDAIARVPGISIETDTGEARYINIRGLDADLNSTTFGGLRLPPTNNASPSGGGRAVAFDAIPVGFIGAIKVTKTNLPEQDAEALGGTIDITPKTVPLDGKPFADVTLGTGIEPLRSTWVENIQATVGGRFGGTRDWRPLSVLMVGEYYSDRRGVDDLEEAYQDAQPIVPDKAFNALEQRRYQYHRQRHGYGIDLGYDPDDRNSYFLRYYDAGYTQLTQRQRLLFTMGVNYANGNNVGIDPGNSQMFIDNVTADKTLRDLKEIVDSKVFDIGGKNRFVGGSVLDYHVGYTKGTYHKPYDYNPDFSNPTPGVIRYNNTAIPDFPSYTVTGVNPVDPAGYTLTNFNDSSLDSNDHEWGVGANLMIPTHFTQDDGENMKFGVNARLRHRTSNGQVYTYNAVPPLPLTQAITGANTLYYGDHYPNGPDIAAGVLRSLYGNGANPDFVRNVASDALSSAQQFGDAKENVLAIYGQYEFGFGRLGMVGGLRIERTNATYGADAVVTPITGARYIVPVSVGHTYTNFFPSLQARYQINDDLIVRGALSSTIARPGFNQVDAATNVDPGAGTVQTGNPLLKPTTAHSLDIAVDRALPHAGTFSVGLFAKEISNYIVAIQTTQTLANNGLFAAFVGPVHVFTYGNVPNAHVWGIEENYIQRMRGILPGVFGGLGFIVNYTWVDSRFQIRPGDESPLPSSSRNTANLELMYESESGRLNMTTGAYFVSRDLFTVGGSAATDNWNQRRLSLDFGSSYRVNSSLRLQFDAKNLLDTALKITEGPGENRPIQREFYGRTILAGFEYKF